MALKGKNENQMSIYLDSDIFLNLSLLLPKMQSWKVLIHTNNTLSCSLIKKLKLMIVSIAH